MHLPRIRLDLPCAALQYQAAFRQLVNAYLASRTAHVDDPAAPMLHKQFRRLKDEFTHIAPPVCLCKLIIHGHGTYRIKSALRSRGYIYGRGARIWVKELPMSQVRKELMAVCKATDQAMRFCEQDTYEEA